MRLRKDSTRLKAILLVTDILLVLAIGALTVFCVKLYMDYAKIPKLDYDQKLAELDARETEVDGQIQTLQEQWAAESAEYETQLQQLQTVEKEISAELETLTAQRDEAKRRLDDIQDPERMKVLIADLRTEYGETVRKLEDMILAGESDYRICYLTFDDGPTYYTDRFLEKLAELDAYATFFTIGCSMKESKTLRNNLLRQEALGGHSIANHTYTHAYYGPLYRSVDSFMDAVEKQDELVYEVTGIHTDIVRFPSGSYYTPYRKGSIQALLDAGYQWMDWIGNAYDAGGNDYSAAQIAGTVIKQARADKITVILMHDWNENTLGSLERIITTLRAENYLFLPLFKESTTNGNCVPKWD